MRVDELAGRLGLSYEGEGGVEIRGAADLSAAREDELAFVGGRKHWAAAEASQAGCLLVDASFPAAGRTVMRAADARGAFAAALRVLYPVEQPRPGVHASAVIGEGVLLEEGVHIGPQVSVGAGAQIGAGTVIGAGCVVGEGVKIGARCWLHPRVTVYAGVTIGARCILHAGAVIGADGFGFAPVAGVWEKFPQVGTVWLGDDVEVGANACIDRAALGVTRIGNGVKLDNMVHIAHNCEIGDHVVIAAQTGLSGGVTVGHHAIIGGQVGIGDKARIESGAILGSGCGVLTAKIVRAGQPVWGTPARPLKQYLEQLAQMGRLGQWQTEIRQLQATVREMAERLGLPAEAPDKPHH